MKDFLTFARALFSAALAPALFFGAGLAPFPAAAAENQPKGARPEEARPEKAYPSDPASFLLSQKDILFRLHEADLTEEEQERQLDLVLEENFAMPQITRYVLGRQWKKITEDQKQRFACIFKRVMIGQVQLYRELIGDALSESQIQIKSQKEARPGLYSLATVIISPSGKATNVSWRIRQTKAGRHQIRDISIEGVSLIVNMRQSYKSLIRAKGGFEPFLEDMREKAGLSADEDACAGLS